MGTYDGGGYEISNMRVTNMRGGLFDRLQAVDSVVIKNITLVDAIISCDADVGSTGLLASYTSGDIENCSVEGSITAASTQNIGGLVGILDANVDYCGAYVDLAGIRSIGGIAGQVSAPVSIEHTFATGEIIASGNEYGSYTGGVIGWSQASSVTLDSTYFVGEIRGANGTLGGLIGGKSSEGDTITISDCYVVSKITSNNGESGTTWGKIIGSASTTIPTDCYHYVEYLYTGNTSTQIVKGTPKALDQMKQEATFANWDFSSVWDIDENSSFPYLTDNVQLPHPIFTFPDD